MSLADWIGITANCLSAVASAGAVIVAVVLWRADRREARAAEANANREHLKGLIWPLRVEIERALEGLDARQFAVEHALATVAEARRRGDRILERPAKPGTLTITDAIVYRSVASTLGSLPPKVIRDLAAFYTLTIEITRQTELSDSAELAYATMKEMVPRLRMAAALTLATLDKFEKSDFSAEADLNPAPEEIRALAEKHGYPLDRIMEERTSE